MKELKEFSLKEEYVPRSILYIVVHCSATRANIPFTEEQLLQCHETWLQMYRVSFLCDEGWRAASHPPNE